MICSRDARLMSLFDGCHLLPIYTVTFVQIPVNTLELPVLEILALSIERRVTQE